MRIFKIINKHRIVRNMKKKFTYTAGQNHIDTGQFTINNVPDLGIRIGLLHAYCNSGNSFDTARCCLLFFDWYVQKINKTKHK